MGDDALRRQFQVLQEENKKRLVKKNEDVSKSEKKSDTEGNSSIDSSYNVDANLNLQLFSKVQNIKETDDYKDLKETVHELQDENGRLWKLLAEKDEELKIVRRRWKAEKEELVGGGIGAENTASKIIEFSRKIRELAAHLEKEKLRSQNLQKKLDLVENKPTPLDIKLTPTEKQELSLELLKTKEKLSHALLKSTESRSAVEVLKKELKMAHKVIAREVGDDFSIHSLLKGSSGWRGRQQEILTLQLKVAELQQLCGSKVSSVRSAPLCRINQYTEKHCMANRKIEAESKEKQEKLREELVSLKNERDLYKEKNSAARTRNKIISQDMKNVKEQMTALNSKGRHDDELISVLLREHELVKEENNRLKTEMADKSALGKRVLRVSGDFSIERSENDCVVGTLKEEINAQEEKVKKLEKELDHLKKSKTSQEKRSHIPRPLSSSGRLMTTSSNGSCDQSKGFDSPLLQETLTLYEAANVEKEKLGELVQVLQRRNEEVVKRLLNKDFKLSELRKSNADLRKQVEKLSFSRSRSSCSRSSSSIRNQSDKESPLQERLTQAESKLVIQTDNNDALKSALDSTLKAKEEDLRAFHNITEQTKKIFLHGLRQYRQKFVPI